MDIRVLGPLAVVDGSEPVALTRPKVRELVATLAALGGWVDAYDLADLMWEVDSHRRKPVLYQTVFNARRAMGEQHAWRIEGVRDRGFRFVEDENDGDTVDLREFNRRKAAGLASFRRGDHRVAVEDLESALDLVPDDRQLADLPETPEMRTRLTTALRKDFDCVRETWLRGRMILREFHEIQPALERLVGRDPLAERWWAMLMQAHYLSSGTASAQAVFRRAQAVFEAEGGDLGEVAAMRARIEDGDPALLMPSSLAEGSAAGIRLRPQQLPPDLPGFTGRTAVLDDLTTKLTGPSAGEVVRVAITGGPGEGKSALAVRLAHAVRDRYPDGQLYYELGGSELLPREPGDVLAEMLRTCGVRDADVPAAVTERANLFRSLLAERRVLIVLDDAAGPEQIEALLPGMPGSAVILTGTDQLGGVPGAHLVRLEPLESGEATDLLRQIIGARRVDADPGGASAIVAACEGSPLAVQIAGARLATRRNWSLAAFAVLLSGEDRLDHLSAGDLDMRRRIEPTYRNLPSAEARVMCTAGLLGTAEWGAWTVEMALGEDCSQPLTRLAERGLVQEDLDPVGRPRYRLPGLVADFCRERWHADPSAGAAVDRLVAGARDLLEQATAQHQGSRNLRPAGRRRGPGRGASALLGPDPGRWLEAELPAMRAIAEAAADSGRDHDARRLVSGLSAYLRSAGHIDAARSLPAVEADDVPPEAAGGQAAWADQAHAAAS